MRFKLLIFSLFAVYVVNSDPNKINEERICLIGYAEEKLGTQYDGKNIKGFDCSGFTRYVYNNMGISIPRSSRMQSEIGTKINPVTAKVGDIIVFTGANDKNRTAGHVGIIHHVNKKRIYFIHSSSSEGVMINHTDQPYYKKRLLHAVKVLES